jgi:hypothetical protein
MLDAGWPSAIALVQLKKCLILHRSKTTKMLPAKGGDGISGGMSVLVPLARIFGLRCGAPAINARRKHA